MTQKMTPMLSFDAIPDLNCNGNLSINRIIRNLPVSLDTTSLIGTYNFASDTFDTGDITGVLPSSDLTAIWEHEVLTIGTGSQYAPPSEDSCIVGSDVTKPDDIFLSFYNPAINLQIKDDGVSRQWVTYPLPCSGATTDGDPDGGTGGGLDGGKALLGPVAFANPRVAGHGLPTFIPRAGGGGGDDAPCNPENVTIRVYNDSGKNIAKGSPIGIGSFDKRHEVYYCHPYTKEWQYVPWGVAAEAIKDGDYGCCIVLGVFELDEDKIEGALTKDKWRISPNFDGDKDQPYKADPKGAAIKLNKGLFLLDRDTVTPAEGEDGYQFKVVNVTQDPAKPRVSVIDSTDPTSIYAGKINDITYVSNAFDIPRDGRTRFIYAIDRYLELLNDSFESNIIPCLCIALVTADPNSDTVTILQSVKGSNLRVNVEPTNYGPVEIDYTSPRSVNGVMDIDYSIKCEVTLNYSNTCSFSCGSSVAAPNKLDESGDMETPKDISLYIDKVIVPMDTTPTAVIGYDSGTISNPEFEQRLFSYVYDEDRSMFSVKYVNNTSNFFTLTKFIVNATDNNNTTNN